MATAFLSPVFMLILRATDLRTENRGTMFPSDGLSPERTEGPSVLLLKLLPPLLTCEHSATELGRRPVSIKINL